MFTWFLISLTLLMAPEGDSKQLAQKGYTAFREVLSGDEAKLPEAIRYLEQAKTADETYVPNLYNLARAYFFEGITFDKEESIRKAEKTFARLLELDPNRTDALAFHGAILALSSRGQDLQLFMRGAEELKMASEKTPDDITVRIVQAVVSQQVPPQALPMIGLKNPVKNVEFVAGVFDTFSSDFAPHASVVMNAFIGETLMQQGEKDKARASFETALKVPQPVDAGAIAGRKILDDAIRARMSGNGRNIFEVSAFSGCHSCHLTQPDKLLPR
jgi:tetratricopeptide (TPR) repeat protein